MGRRTERAVRTLTAQVESEPAPDYELESSDSDVFVPSNRTRRVHRSVSLTEQINALTKDGTQITAFFSAVMKGQIKGTLKDRVEAAKWLAERKWGKTPDTVLHAHAHGVAEIPPEITSAVLTAIARGEKLDPASLLAPTNEVVIERRQEVSPVRADVPDPGE